MKKSIALFIATVLILSLAACGTANSGRSEKVTANVSGGNVDAKNGNTTQASEETDASDPKALSKAAEITVPEQVVYDENNVKITITSLSMDAFMGPELKVLIENNNEKNIAVQVRNVSINDIMVDTMFSSDVVAGKKANDGITFMTSDLDVAQIEVIKNIEFSFHIFDADTWDTIHDSDQITIETSADKSIVQTYDDSGFVAVDTNGLRIIVKKLDDENSFWGADVSVYIENNSEQNVTVQVRDVSINGFMVEPSFSCDVPVNKKAFSDITFFESDLSDNNITDIRDIELVFHIFNMESWDTILDTDVVSISFK